MVVIESWKLLPGLTLLRGRVIPSQSYVCSKRPFAGSQRGERERGRVKGHSGGGVMNKCVGIARVQAENSGCTRRTDSLGFG